MCEKRPEINLGGTKTDGKLLFMSELIQVCWQQNPGTRPNFKQIGNRLKDLMESEPAKNPFLTPIQPVD